MRPQNTHTHTLKICSTESWVQLTTQTLTLSAGFLSFRCVGVYGATEHVFHCLRVCGRDFSPRHVPMVTTERTQSFPPLALLVLGCQRPVASRCAAPSVIPAHEPDSHHKAPIVFAGRTGSHSACHSAATCVTRRHSGAYSSFCFLLSGLHTDDLSLKQTIVCISIIYQLKILVMTANKQLFLESL